MKVDLQFFQRLTFRTGLLKSISRESQGRAQEKEHVDWLESHSELRQSQSRFECIYLRPTNGRAEDQVRRNHSVQYISNPGFPWHLLRKDFPEKYESYVDLVTGEWTKVKIEVRGEKARLCVNGAGQPTLLVNDLKQGLSKGSVALWVGTGTVARFSNLKVSP